MIRLQIAGIFYQFFALSKDFTLSEVKRKQIEKELIERRPNVLDKNIVNSSYFLLLYLGIIDRVTVNGKLAYRLMQSTIISGSERTIYINDPIKPNEVQFVGLNYKVVENEEKNSSKNIFDSLDVLKVIPKISDIIKKRFIFDVEKPTYSSLEQWLPNNKNSTWSEVKRFDVIPSLYKVHLNDKNHYEYCFCNKGNFYKFPLNDFLTAELVKSYLLVLSKKVAFMYDDAIGELFELLPILEPIRKTLFTHHILTTGDIPLDYRYQIDSKIYKQIKRIYK
ncbi:MULTISPECIES: hypothetical protein [unclassified Sphingobacterium]|uniref:hypothetical protein n=1 Tax=unclassified Sphingobacterium TaxID=2609468 RepID=UPI00105278BF|nr:MULTISPECIES: hypothetical protein [unclassified Sphingobacterium]MCS3556929.1 hypothetical protein [Sphingobacterium sp. JUb21]TCQ98933.1 hypothetical protein EDF66_11643 [Sphingobacterium sp. JUb20]